jgi:hypothetical protein
MMVAMSSVVTRYFRRRLAAYLPATHLAGRPFDCLTRDRLPLQFTGTPARCSSKLPEPRSVLRSPLKRPRDADRPLLSSPLCGEIFSRLLTISDRKSSRAFFYTQYRPVVILQKFSLRHAKVLFLTDARKLRAHML